MFRRLLYIFTLVLFISVQVYGQSLPSAVINAMSSRQTRYHHFIWHQIRNLWNRFDSDTQNAIRRLGWAPPRPAQRFTSSGSAVVIEDNRAGEDFLYMHRQMIQRVNSLSSFRVNGWESIPEPGDDAWPVPPSYTTPESQTNDLIRNVKTNSYYYNTLRPRENRFKDPDYLRSISLGRLGTELEFTIHNNLHVRWSARSSYGYRPRPSNDPLPDVSTRWDNPSYVWLVDNYASHVNPVFWKLHGWVDDRIEDWRRANGLSSITWRGTWVGGPLSRLDELVDAGDDAGFRNLGESHEMCGEGDGNMDVLEEVARIIKKTGLQAGPCDDVLFESDLSEEERQNLIGKKYDGEPEEDDEDEVSRQRKKSKKRSLRQKSQN